MTDLLPQRCLVTIGVAERARSPFAEPSLYKVPDQLSDEQASLVWPSIQPPPPVQRT